MHEVDRWLRHEVNNTAIWTTQCFIVNKKFRYVSLLHHSIHQHRSLNQYGNSVFTVSTRYWVQFLALWNWRETRSETCSRHNFSLVVNLKATRSPARISISAPKSEILTREFYRYTLPCIPHDYIERSGWRCCLDADTYIHQARSIERIELPWSNGRFRVNSFMDSTFSPLLPFEVNESPEHL